VARPLEVAGLELLTLRHPDALPPDARALLALAECDGVELGAAWYRNLLATLPGMAANAYFHVLRRAGRAVAVLPVLSADPHGKGDVSRGCVQSLANYYSALWAPALDASLTPVELAPLLRQLARLHAPLHTLHWAPMDPETRAWATLSQALRLAALPTWDFLAFGNWYLPVDMDWAAYLASRPGELRNTLRRSEKRLSKAGARIEIVSAGERLETAARAYERVYAASWKQPEPHPAFMPGLIRTCAEQGWLRLGVVWLQEQPIAAQLWIVAHGKASIYKLAYDEAFKALGSGTVLTARLMQHVLDVDRVTEVDYLMGDDPYKRSWMSHRRERRGLRAYNVRTARGLLGAAREVVARLSRPLRNSRA
jgi:CelD/BcsL family acetyltransferase involved in cellulose biosynthesis